MSLALGCVADDYTGASDLANTLTKAGLRTVQTIGIPADDLSLPEVDAVVVALKSRSIPAEQAVARSREAEAWLRGRGAGHILFKVCSTFDSTDAGNIGPVLDALREDAGEAIALVTPAFPETGRSVYQGHLFVGATPLNESPLKDHPLNPMRDSNLVRVLARQSRKPVGLIDVATVAQGADAVARRLDALAAEGNGGAIADAIFDSDLEVLGRAALARKVSVGASGLGLGLARALVAQGR
ncbi:four-carbon acid sugar kinase family protein, partial [Methylobacterium trifolii]